MGSYQVPKCSSRVFPIAPRFNLICFAQSPPLLAYIGGPKREALHLSIKSSISESLHSFSFPLLIAKKKVALVRHPQLINMKQKQYSRLSFFSCPLLTFLYRSLSFTPEDVRFHAFNTNKREDFCYVQNPLI